MIDDRELVRPKAARVAGLALNGEGSPASPAIEESATAADARRILQGEGAATVKITSPIMNRSVKLPVELMRMEPVLLIVPPRVVTEALFAMNAPLLVTSLRVAVPRLRITPLPKVVSVPPLIVTPPVSWTSEPSSAWINPSVLLKSPCHFPSVEAVRRRSPA